MSCGVCKDLMRVLNLANSDYGVALSGPYYLVSTEIAAKMQVDMERAKIALSEHLSSCSVGILAEDALLLVPVSS
jgi:hypothetical protein